MPDRAEGSNVGGGAGSTAALLRQRRRSAPERRGARRRPDPVPPGSTAGLAGSAGRMPFLEGGAAPPIPGRSPSRREPMASRREPRASRPGPIPRWSALALGLVAVSSSRVPRPRVLVGAGAPRARASRLAPSSMAGVSSSRVPRPWVRVGAGAPRASPRRSTRRSPAHAGPGAGRLAAAPPSSSIPASAAWPQVGAPRRRWRTPCRSGVVDPWAGPGSLGRTRRSTNRTRRRPGRTGRFHIVRTSGPPGRPGLLSTGGPRRPSSERHRPESSCA